MQAKLRYRQFIAKDFKGCLRGVGITHLRTRFYDPQSNGKEERAIQTRKNEAVRRQSYPSLEDLKEQPAASLGKIQYA